MNSSEQNLKIIHPRLLKELPEKISEPMAIIFAKLWMTDGIPENWRRANTKGGKINT